MKRSTVSFSGRFLALLISTLFASFAARAGEVQDYLVAKAKLYKQTSTNAPVLITASTNDMPFVFHCDVGGTTNHTLVSGTLRTPGGVVKTLESDEHDHGDELIFDDGFSTEAALNTAYPNGAYTLKIVTGHSGTNTFSVNLPAPAYPKTPRISNYAQAQMVNPSNVFRLQWDALAGTTADRIRVEVRDNSNDGDHNVFSTADILEGGGLNGTATYVDIPAHTLGSGKTYEVQIINAKFTSMVTNSGTRGFAGYATLMNAPLKTAGKPDTNSPLVLSAVLDKGLVTLKFNEAIATNHWYFGPYGIKYSNYRWTADKRSMSFNVTGTNGTTFGVGLYGLKDLSGNGLATNGYVEFKIMSANVSPASYSLVGSNLVCNVIPPVQEWEQYYYRYQWQRNGTNVPGATASTYRPTTDGAYRAIAKYYGYDMFSYSIATTPSVTAVHASQVVPVYLQNTNGTIAVWYFHRTNFMSSIWVNKTVAPGWHMAAQGDLNRDGRPDFLFQKSTNLMVWTMNGTTFVRTNKVNYRPPAGTLIASAKDFSGDGNLDFLEYNPANTAVRYMKMFYGTNSLGAISLRNRTAGWSPVAVANFAGDAKEDIVWQNTSGTNRLAVAWYGTNFLSTASMFNATPVPTGWNICGAADFTGDGQKDIMLQSTAGQFAIRVMSRTNYTRTVLPRGSYIPPAGWKIVGPK